MYKLILLLGLAAVAFASETPVATPVVAPIPVLNQNYLVNPYNAYYKGNQIYQPYRHNSLNYFNKDYQKYNLGNYYNNNYYNNDFYNRDVYNKNYYNNEYYQKYNKDARSAGILRFVNDAQPDGSYQYGYETQNGIAAEQQGVVRVAADQTAPVVVQGFYRYTSPEGTPVEVRYTADEFGYHPEGNVIPGQEQAFAYKKAVLPAVEVQKK